MTNKDNDRMEIVKQSEIKALMTFLEEDEYEVQRFAEIVAEGVVQGNAALQLAATNYSRAGAALLVAKQAAGHGKWDDFLKAAGLNERTARRYMLVARRASDMNALGKPLMGLGLHKTEAMLALPEPELKVLLEGGVVGDLTIDRIERMGVMELRKEVNKLAGKLSTAQGKVKKGSEQLSRKDDHIRRLEGRNMEIVMCKPAVKMGRAMELISLALGDKLPDKDAADEWMMLEGQTRAAYELARQAYNKFKTPHKLGIKHKLPQNMAEIEDEFTLTDEEKEHIEYVKKHEDEWYKKGWDGTFDEDGKPTGMQN